MSGARVLLVVLIGAALAGCGDDEVPAADAADAAPPDAPTPPCGIEAPGTRCADATTLERCDGTAIVSDDCAAQGQLCGPDPAAAGGAACVATGQACGQLDFLGACEGDTLAYCDEEDGLLVVSDCRERYAMCAYTTPSVGHDCTTTCALMGVTAGGTCTPEGIRRCEFAGGAYAVVVDACPAGTTCQPNVIETHAPQCVAAGACASVGPAGRCAGDVLTRCEGGTPQTSDCAAAGGVCAYGGVDEGFVCAGAGDAGASVVSGVVRYQDRPPIPDGTLGALAPQPARGVAVALVADEGGAVLAAGLTADDGSYTLRHDAAAGVLLHVLVATTSPTASRPARVIRPDGLVHGFGAPSFVAAATVAQDVLVTDASGVSAAFNVFDQMLRALDYVRAELGDDTPEPFYVVWSRGFAPSTSRYFAAQNGIELLGALDDDDGYDDTVILHETGHYLEDAIGRSSSPGGPHNFGTAADPRLAWSEGFATYWAMVLRDDPHYMDSNAFGGFGLNGDTRLTPAPMPLGVMMQDVPEDMVTQILWDVGDVGAADDDAFTEGSHAQVLRVAPEYLDTAQLADRGVLGVDLVDALDGFFLDAGLAACAGVRAVVTADHKFPYDFGGPAGLCP